MPSGELMDSRVVHQPGCTLSVHPGVGATPMAWGGFTSLLRQAPFDRAQDRRDGEPVEPLEGESRQGRDRLVKWLEEKFYEVIKIDTVRCGDCVP